jgi:hypothetical protein
VGHDIFLFDESLDKKRAVAHIRVSGETRSRNIKLYAALKVPQFNMGCSGSGGMAKFDDLDIWDAIVFRGLSSEERDFLNAAKQITKKRKATILFE